MHASLVRYSPPPRRHSHALLLLFPTRRRKPRPPLTGTPTTGTPPTLIMGVASGITMTAVTFSFFADRATPCAWLPALFSKTRMEHTHARKREQKKTGFQASFRAGRPHDTAAAARGRAMYRNSTYDGEHIRYVANKGDGLWDERKYSRNEEGMRQQTTYLPQDSLTHCCLVLRRCIFRQTFLQNRTAKLGIFSMHTRR